MRCGSELLAGADHLLDALHLSLHEDRVPLAMDAFQRLAGLLRASIFEMPVRGLWKKRPGGQEYGHENELYDDDGLIRPFAFNKVGPIRDEPGCGSVSDEEVERV